MCGVSLGFLETSAYVACTAATVVAEAPDPRSFPLVQCRGRRGCGTWVWPDTTSSSELSTPCVKPQRKAWLRHDQSTCVMGQTWGCQTWGCQKTFSDHGTQRYPKVSPRLYITILCWVFLCLMTLVDSCVISSKKIYIKIGKPMETYGNGVSMAISWAAPHSGGGRMILLVRRCSRAARAVRETRDDGGIRLWCLDCRILFHVVICFYPFLDHAGVGWKDRTPIFWIKNYENCDNCDCTSKRMGGYLSWPGKWLAKYCQPSGSNSSLAFDTPHFLNPTRWCPIGWFLQLVNIINPWLVRY